MPHTFPYLINEKLNINGKNIFCKVTGKSNSANDGQLFVLMIPAGPGLDHQLSEIQATRWLPLADKAYEGLPHFIFFDSLGCGQSDISEDPKSEYTIDYYTDLAISLVEAIKAKLGLTEMNVCVMGNGFASAVAMNFPARAQNWLNPDSEVNLVQVNSITGNNGADMQNYSREYIKNNYDNPKYNYEAITTAVNKLYAGNFKDQTDYLCNFILPLATLYKPNIGFTDKCLLSIGKYFPNIFRYGIDFLNRLTQYIGMPVENLQLYDISINKFSVPVLNYFYHSNFNGFNLKSTVENNLAAYQKVPICLVTETKQYAIRHTDFVDIFNLLPNSSSLIVYDHGGMLSEGKTRESYTQLGYDLAVSHFINEENLRRSYIEDTKIPQGFKDMLANVRSLIPPKHNLSINNLSVFAKIEPPTEVKQNDESSLTQRHSEKSISRPN